MYLPDWLTCSRWFGLAIAGTLIPYTVFALTKEKLAETGSTSASPSDLAVETLVNARTTDGLPTAPPKLNPKESVPRSPIARLGETLRDRLPFDVAGTDSMDSPLQAIGTTEQFNPFALFLRGQAPPSSSLPQVSSMAPLMLSDPTAGVPLTLPEAIAIAVTHNTTIKNAYLDRVVERADLRTARGELNPKLTPILSTTIEDDVPISTLTTDPDRDEFERGDRRETELRARVSWLVPTGGKLAVDWRTQLHAFAEPNSREVQITFTQPLLRDGESTTARLAYQRARLQEDINLLELRNILSRQITNTITLYRQLLLAQEQVKQTQLSLINAQEELQRQSALVAAGREARYTLLGQQQNVADFKSQLLGAQNAVKSAQLNLMNQLGSDRDFNVVAVDESLLNQPNLTLDPQQIEQISFAQRPDYLQRLIALQIAEINTSEASNQRLWNLDLAAAYNRALELEADWSATLSLSRNLGDRRREEAAFKRAEVDRLKQQNNLVQAQADIKIEVSNQIRQVGLELEQWRLAQEEVRLIETELTAQQALTRAGRGASDQLQDIQRRLLEVRNKEISQRIDYLNAISTLEQVQGITLQRWGIQLDPQR